ncbi:unnamed protein product [Caenorhabditis bovis]|uniref:Uncharacterized protein n=1 Tax=Caenorhabditis bovis TaxID=2654633 RepID=A0A8S1FF78_9PELO|nr:unnamed protein product [Caenorhabditis bovis]
MKNPSTLFNDDSIQEDLVNQTSNVKSKILDQDGERDCTFHKTKKESYYDGEEDKSNTNTGSFVDPVDIDDELRRLKKVCKIPYWSGSSFFPVETLPILSWKIPRRKKKSTDDSKTSTGIELPDILAKSGSIHEKCMKPTEAFWGLTTSVDLFCVDSTSPSLSLDSSVTSKKMKILDVSTPLPQKLTKGLEKFKDPADMTEELAKLKTLFKRPYWVKSGDEYQVQSLETEISNLEAFNKLPKGQRKRNARGQFLIN